MSEHAGMQVRNTRRQTQKKKKENNRRLWMFDNDGN